MVPGKDPTRKCVLHPLIAVSSFPSKPLRRSIPQVQGFFISTACQVGYPMCQAPQGSRGRQQFDQVHSPVFESGRFVIRRKPVHPGNIDVTNQDKSRDDRPKYNVQKRKCVSLENDRRNNVQCHVTDHEPKHAHDKSHAAHWCGFRRRLFGLSLIRHVHLPNDVRLRTPP